MNYVLSAKQMKDIDNRTINELGIPSRVLMENAGKRCAELIIDLFENDLIGSVAILCGSGNNGGDGAVVARWLYQKGVSVAILIVSSKSLTPDNKANLDICQNLGIPVTSIESLPDWEDIWDRLDDVTLLVDAIYGTGFKGELPPMIHRIIESAQRDVPTIVSIDIPSGIDADTGMGKGAIMASATFALGALKLGHLIGDGAEHCGELHLIDIGIPDMFLGDLDCGHLLDINDLNLPFRTPFGDKSAYGSLAVFAGSEGLTGAAVLACQAALRSGAGLVTLYHRAALSQIFEIKLTEVMTRSIPETEDGLPDPEALFQLLIRHNAILIGCGISQSDYALKLMEIALTHQIGDTYPPMVIDADGLRLLAKHRHLMVYLADRNVVLTPHIREFAALTGVEVDLIKRDIVRHLKEFVTKYRCPVLLKGKTSIYYNGSVLLFNNTGNDGLATGGSGDVLAGIISSFMAQDPDLANPAIYAAQIMGLTAELLAKRKLPYAITPSDVIEHLFVFAGGDTDA